MKREQHEQRSQMRMTTTLGEREPNLESKKKKFNLEIENKSWQKRRRPPTSPLPLCIIPIFTLPSSSSSSSSSSSLPFLIQGDFTFTKAANTRGCPDLFSSVAIFGLCTQWRTLLGVILCRRRNRYGLKETVKLKGSLLPAMS